MTENDRMKLKMDVFFKNAQNYEDDSEYVDEKWQRFLKENTKEEECRN